MLKNYLKSLLFLFVIILSLTIIITILNYFGIINGYILSIIKLLIPIIAIIYSAYKIGSNSLKKGYLEGIKFGTFVTILFILLNLLLNHNFDIKSIIYYLILIGTSTLSSMIGIMKKSN